MDSPSYVRSGLRPDELYYSSFYSDYTKNSYKVYLNRYFQTIGCKNIDELLSKSPRQIENELIQFIISLKDRGCKFSTIHNYINPVLRLCKINDIILNASKVNRFMPRPVHSTKKSREYTVQEISSLLQIADERMRAVILILSSSGLRINGLCGLTYGSLKSVNNDTMYQLTVYENEPEEYVTFVSNECRSKGIDPYTRLRERYGEVIKETSPLIREQFDRRDPFAAAHPKRANAPQLAKKLTEMAEAAGIRTRTQLEAGQKAPAASQRKEVPICNGFRRFHSTTLANSNINVVHRWRLEGHALISNDPSYVHISPSQLLESYLIGHDNLLIDQSHKLQQRIEKMEIERSLLDKLAASVRRIEAQMKEL